MSGPCAICAAPHSSFGIGPPAQPEQRWYCGKCMALQPAAQRALAIQARTALDDPEVMAA